MGDGKAMRTQVCLHKELTLAGESFQVHLKGMDWVWVLKGSLWNYLARIRIYQVIL